MGLVDASILAHSRPLPRLFRQFKSPFFATPKATDCRLARQPALPALFARAMPFGLALQGATVSSRAAKYPNLGLFVSCAKVPPMEYSPKYRRFRALLRDIREEAGLSQLALAKKLGKPQSYVCKSEIGERAVDFLEILDFCAACNIPAAEFIKRFQQGVTAPKTRTRQKRRPSGKPAV